MTQRKIIRRGFCSEANFSQAPYDYVVNVEGGFRFVDLKTTQPDTYYRAYCLTDEKARELGLTDEDCNNDFKNIYFRYLTASWWTTLDSELLYSRRQK